MGNSSKMGETLGQAGASRITRRNALKAGVAAGVGVAVWGGPQIGRIGSTPAYAAHCTIPNVRYAAIKGNIDAGQRRYKDPTPLTCGTMFPGTSELLLEGAPGECGGAVPTPGAPGGVAGVCLQPSALSLQGQFCTLEVQILDNQGEPCDNPTLEPSVSPNPVYSIAVQIDSSTWIPLPDPNNASALKYRVFVVCNADEACLPS